MNVHHREWPPEGLTRVPYWIYSDPDIYAREQDRVFRGPIWNFLCLEAEVSEANTFRRSAIGDMQVVVTRDGDGELHAFENRCAHRGALLCLHEQGEAKEFSCVYHNWTYDLSGKLTGIAFRRGIGGKGGMPADAQPESQAPRKLRLTVFAGLVFGTCSDATPPIEDYLGPDISAKIRRVMRAPVKLMGGYSQMLNNNWKLYFENVKDTYHASLLHTFFTTFRLNRLSQKGGVVINESGGSHISFSIGDALSSKEYEQAKLRAAQDGFVLEAPEMLQSVDEFGDDVGLQILTVFPNFVLQQIRNSLAVRRVVPIGPERTELVWMAFGFVDDDDEMTERRLRQANLMGPAGYISMEDGAATGFVQRGVAAAKDFTSVVEMGGASVSSAESRVTEASVRAFWKHYRQLMDM